MASHGGICARVEAMQALEALKGDIMGRPDIPGFDKAQAQYDNQGPEDFEESEDDIPGAMEDIIEEEKEEKWRRGRE